MNASGDWERALSAVWLSSLKKQKSLQSPTITSRVGPGSLAVDDRHVSGQSSRYDRQRFRLGNDRRLDTGGLSAAQFNRRTRQAKVPKPAPSTVMECNVCAGDFPRFTVHVWDLAIADQTQKPRTTPQQAKLEMEPLFQYFLRLAPAPFRKEVHYPIRPWNAEISSTW